MLCSLWFPAIGLCCQDFLSLVKSICGCAFAFITTNTVFEYNRVSHSPVVCGLSTCCAGHMKLPKKNLGQELRVCCLTQMKFNNIDFSGSI